MQILIYRITGKRGSIYTAMQVADVVVNEVPHELDEFAAEHNGDYAQVDWNTATELEPVWQS